MDTITAYRLIIGEVVPVRAYFPEGFYENLKSFGGREMNPYRGLRKRAAERTEPTPLPVTDLQSVTVGYRKIFSVRERGLAIAVGGSKYAGATK